MYLHYLEFLHHLWKEIVSLKLVLYFYTIYMFRIINRCGARADEKALFLFSILCCKRPKSKKHVLKSNKPVCIIKFNTQHLQVHGKAHLIYVMRSMWPSIIIPHFNEHYSN